MASVSGVCKLCLKHAKLVDSHIIPRSFYEEYRAKPLKAISSSSTRARTIQIGIYGQFLCGSCEAKFNELDTKAFDFIKNKANATCVAENVEGRELLVVENAITQKELIHKFALSVLWRAANSNREEYHPIELGIYNEKIRIALESGKFEQNLLDATGLMLWEFRGSVVGEADVVAHPYQLFTRKTHPQLIESFGNFRVHSFGYPYGEMLIRLGGERPKTGFYRFVEKEDLPVVLWSTNLSESYPNLVILKTPRIASDGKTAGSKVQKELFEMLKGKARG